MMKHSDIAQYKGISDWRSEVKGWINSSWTAFDPIMDSIVSFFELSFENTYCPKRAWFGVHQSTVSLVVGGIFLAAIINSSQDRGFWLLVDQQPPLIDGIEYKPVRSTQRSKFPLTWAHSESLSFIPDVVTNGFIWKSFASASEKILYSPRIANDRDPVQERRKKKRLSEFWTREPIKLFPDEIEEINSIREGAEYRITVNAYERDPKARRQCIEYYGTSCFICGFSFGAVYGEVAEGFVHVHHLQPLSEIGSEYIVNPVKDLRPVCPNCHAVLHLHKPAFSIQEVMEFLRQR
jgi:hypothetical protein